MSRSTRVRGPPVVDGIDDSIINYELGAPHLYAQVGEFIGEFDSRDSPAKFISSAVTRNITASRYVCISNKTCAY